MLSFSISYRDLIKFHYFADTTERERIGKVLGGPKQAQRQRVKTTGCQGKDIVGV
jgi:hypothetical protein